MAVVTRRHQQTTLIPDQPLRQTQSPGYAQKSIIVPALKAGKFGGLGLLTLVLAVHIPWPAAFSKITLLALLIPAFLLVALATGLLATILAGDSVATPRQGGEIGWLAGFWAGIFGGLFAMLLAAQGTLLWQFGQRLAAHLTPEQLGSWATSVTPELVALAGRVLAALLVYGLLSALMTAVISSIAGLLVAKLSE